MTLNEYQGEARVTAIYKDPIYPFLELTGEAGEVAEKLKRAYRDADEPAKYIADRRRAIAMELGDVLWALSSCAWELGYSLNEIAHMNLEKLRSRMERHVVKGTGDER